MTNNSTLLPCPFCGSPATLTRFERVVAPGKPLPTVLITQIQCTNDDRCQVCVDIQHINEAIAIEAWNTRAASRPAQERPGYVEVSIVRLKELADSAMPQVLFEKECQEQMRVAARLLAEAYPLTGEGG